MDYICRCLSKNEKEHLTIGGMDVVDLANEYGTPVYIMDEQDIRTACREFTQTINSQYKGKSLVAFASKALSFTYIYKIMQQEGLGADVVSGGELFTAINAGMDTKNIIFHGNNKTKSELQMAIDNKVGRIVVDNREELYLLQSLAQASGITVDIAFRLKPGIDAHTHDFIQTGKIDSKFGIAIETGEAFSIVKEALSLPNLRLKGVHCHIGSQIFDADPFELAVKILMTFMKKVKDDLNYVITDLNLGGGFGVRYIESHDPRSVPDVVCATVNAVTRYCGELGLDLPVLILEPGRSLVASSGITVYNVGSVKEIPNIRSYVSVNGGMTDNPRFALYGAAYHAILPERADAPRTKKVTIAGRCCESGDLLAEDILMPEIKAGDLLAVCATGAYNYSMASNYNRVPKPPVVMVNDGTSRLVVRRETYEDLIRCDQI